jgi:hypothetical protein
VSDPFKLRLLKAITGALKEVTPANGYLNDLADFDPGDGVDDGARLSRSHVVR